MKLSENGRLRPRSDLFQSDHNTYCLLLAHVRNIELAFQLSKLTMTDHGMAVIAIFLVTLCVSVEYQIHFLLSEDGSSFFHHEAFHTYRHFSATPLWAFGVSLIVNIYRYRGGYRFPFIPIRRNNFRSEREDQLQCLQQNIREFAAQSFNREFTTELRLDKELQQVLADRSEIANYLSGGLDLFGSAYNKFDNTVWVSIILSIYHLAARLAHFAMAELVWNAGRLPHKICWITLLLALPILWLLTSLSLGSGPFSSFGAGRRWRMSGLVQQIHKDCLSKGSSSILPMEKETVRDRLRWWIDNLLEEDAIIQDFRTQKEEAKIKETMISRHYRAEREKREDAIDPFCVSCGTYRHGGTYKNRARPDLLR